MVHNTDVLIYDRLNNIELNNEVIISSDIYEMNAIIEQDIHERLEKALKTYFSRDIAEAIKEIKLHQ